MNHLSLRKIQEFIHVINVHLIRNIICLVFIFQIILEAIPKDETDQARRYRGYIAVDDLYFESGDSCQGHCTFDSGMCGFLNAKGQDHFDWEVVRTF